MDTILESPVLARLVGGRLPAPIPGDQRGDAPPENAPGVSGAELAERLARLGLPSAPSPDP
jgi:hypothetical protein